MLTSKYLDSIANNTSTFFVKEGTIFQLFTLPISVNKNGNKNMKAETSHLCCFQQLIIFMKKVELAEPFPNSTSIKKMVKLQLSLVCSKVRHKKKKPKRKQEERRLSFYIWADHHSRIIEYSQPAEIEPSDSRFIKASLHSSIISLKLITF